MTPQPPRKALRRAASTEAASSGGALPRWRLLELGFDHAAVRREVDAERWQALGTHTVVLHTGPVGLEARRHVAVWEVAADVALVDGASALQAAGLTGWTEDEVHVSVPRNARCPW